MNEKREDNLIFETYQQLNEEFRDEAHIASSKTRQQARIWFHSMRLPGPRTFSEGESPVPYLQKTVKEFLTVFSKKEWFDVVEGANEMHHLIDEEFDMEVTSAVFQPLVPVVNSLRHVREIPGRSNQ